MKAAILRLSPKGRLATTYVAMLSHAQSNLHLGSLIKSGIVQEVKDGDKMVYKVTPKGVRFLSYHEQMQVLMPLGKDEVLMSIMA